MHDLKGFLDEKVKQFNQPDFIEEDPIQVPHQYHTLQDIEIAGLVAATLAWGQRKTIISKSLEFLKLMDNHPHDFVLNHKESDLKAIARFKHRTFQGTDALYFIDFLGRYYRKHQSLEELFLMSKENESRIKNGLINLHNAFFDAPYAPERTKKHISTPLRNSACKRLNMYLRWMVRKDDAGVDFGLWKNLTPAELICPLDVHVDRVARKYQLLTRKQTDWKAAEELTQNLALLDPADPVKYDFALFGIGRYEVNRDY